MEKERLEEVLKAHAAWLKTRFAGEVLSITMLDGTATERTEIRSDYDRDFIYRVGEIVEVENYNEDRWKECSTGIHFFITRREAVNYV